MTNQISNILESDVIEANDKMLGKETSDENSEVGKAIIFVLFILLIVGVFTHLANERDKKKNKLKIKNDDGSIKEIDLTISDSEIAKALEKLKNS